MSHKTCRGAASGKQLYRRRAGIEGTIAQGVKAFGLRFARYRVLAKTRLQRLATAAAINLDRLIARFDEIPRPISARRASPGSPPVSNRAT